MRGKRPPHNPRKREKHKKTKEKDKYNAEEKTSCPSPLNDSTTPFSSPRQFLSRGPWFKKQKKRQKLGFPIKDLGNDGGEGRS